MGRREEQGENVDIQITIDSEDVMRKLEGALRRAEELRETMPAELTAWQEQDMVRVRANTSAPDAQTAVTMISPRSRRSVPLSRPRHRPRLLRPRRQATAGSQAATVRSRRPILRPELFDRLRERMSELLGKTFASWD
jgi:hypothetical protein